MIKLEINGVPTPWSAPRVYSKTTFSIHTPSKQKTQYLIRSQYNQKPIEDPVALKLTFHMKIPESLSLKKREELTSRHCPHAKKPDLSNLIKFIEDCLKGIVIKDDNQVSIILGEKRYAEHPKTLIEITPLTQIKPPQDSTCAYSFS